MPPDLAGLTRFKATNEVLNPKLITVKLKPRFKSNFDFFYQVTTKFYDLFTANEPNVTNRNNKQQLKHPGVY